MFFYHTGISDRLSAPIVTAEDDDDDAVSSDEKSTSSSDLDDEEDNLIESNQFYDSDLDPDNYDSDLEYELNKEVKKLASAISATREKLKSADGPGHIYIFTDSPSNEKQHRVKVAASKCPDKCFEAARKYNVALKKVSTVPVSKRKAALRLAHESLSGMRLQDDQSDWFKGPLDTILQKVSAATEQHGTGPSLLTFKC